MSLFWCKGYHATSIKDLEGTLAMKPGSIYAAFQSKEAFYLLALERYFETFREQFRAQISEASSPLQGLADHLRAYALLSPEDGTRQACMIVKSFVETRNTEPAIAEQSKAYFSAMRSEISAAFDAAQEQGEIATDVDTSRLAHLFQAYVSALRFELHLGSPQDEIEALAEDMAGAIEALRVK
ncbi:TetR/AcrR family transcriptional regulator [Poseidonocella pacifica]|nr:TetR/AcrR family transcriptional regulator [Poseidonocella pacifica]